MAISKYFGTVSNIPITKGEKVIEVPRDKEDFVMLLLKLGVFDGKYVKHNVRLVIDRKAPRWFSKTKG